MKRTLLILAITLCAFISKAQSGGSTEIITERIINIPEGESRIKILKGQSGGVIAREDTIADGTNGQALVTDGNGNLSFQTVASGGVNLGTTYTSTSATVTNSGGTDATISQAIASGNSGVMSGDDKAKLDGIEALADVTDETNVKSALDGATITTATVSGTDKVLIQDVDDSDNLKTVTALSIANLGGGSGLWTDDNGLTKNTNTYAKGTGFIYKYLDASADSITVKAENFSNGYLSFNDNDQEVFAVTGGATLGSIRLNLGTFINEFSTDETLAGDSDDAIPTEQAVKAYVDNAVSNSDFTTDVTISKSDPRAVFYDTGAAAAAGRYWEVKNEDRDLEFNYSSDGISYLSGMKFFDNTRLRFDLPVTMYASTSDPSVLFDGTFFWDSDDDYLRIYDGSNYRTIAPVSTSLANGDMTYFTGSQFSKWASRISAGTIQMQEALTQAFTLKSTGAGNQNLNLLASDNTGLSITYNPSTNLGLIDMDSGSSFEINSNDSIMADTELFIIESGGITSELEIRSTSNSRLWLIDTNGTGVASSWYFTNTGNNALQIAYDGSGGSSSTIQFYKDSTNFSRDITSSANVDFSIGGGLTVEDNAQIKSIGSTAGAGALYYTADGFLSTSSSTIRKKNNLKTVNDNLSLDKIKQFKPVYFNWQKETDKIAVDPITKYGEPVVDESLDIGLIAEDVEKVDPFMTFTNHNDSIKGVHYQKLTLLLISAMQEQQRQIEILQQEIEVLKTN